MKSLSWSNIYDSYSRLLDPSCKFLPLLHQKDVTGIKYYDMGKFAKRFSIMQASWRFVSGQNNHNLKWWIAS